MKDTTQQKLRQHPAYQTQFDQGSAGNQPEIGMNAVLPKQNDLQRYTHLLLAAQLEKTELKGHQWQEKQLEYTEPYNTKEEIFTIEKKEKFELKPFIKPINSFLEFESKPEGESIISLLQTTYPYKKAMSTTDPLDEVVRKAAARLGYVDGINHFVEEHELDYTKLTPGNNVLEDSTGLTEFVNAMRGSSPNIMYAHTQATEGYKLGFMISTTKRGVVPTSEEVPLNADQFRAYLDGTNATPRLLAKGETTLTTLEDVKGIEASQEPMYKLGLKVWLHENGITDQLENDGLRHPEALNALSKALRGEVIGCYDSKKPNNERTIRDLAQKYYNQGQGGEE